MWKPSINFTEQFCRRQHATKKVSASLQNKHFVMKHVDCESIENKSAGR